MIVKKFQEQVNSSPEKIAIKARNKIITYGELNIEANRVASAVVGKDNKPEADGSPPRVSLLFEHGVDMIAAVMGTLKAHQTYVPLDITYPEKRLLYMLEDSNSWLILTNSKNLPLAEKLVKQSNQAIEILNIDNIADQSPEVESKQEVPGDTMAYILYTSGSTGQPKGVVQTHRNVLYYTRNWIQRFSITGADRMTLFSAFSHDGAVQDMFAALLTGACLYPYYIKTASTSTPEEIYRLLKKEKITIWHSVPSLFRYFANTLTEKDDFPDVRWVLLGGEPLRSHDLELLTSYFPESYLANVYGQTESSVTSICVISRENTFEDVSLGEPLDETEILLVNQDGDVVEDIGVGEIIVACDYLAMGYWKNKKSSEQVFLHNEQMGRLYRTGDMGRLTVHGAIKVTGRKDSQVKIRGFRVEIGEIETTLLRHQAVKEAVVNIKEEKDGNHYLCSYIVTDHPVPPSELRQHLLAFLPDYMVPRYFIPLERMPVTPNGKIHRKALPDPESLNLSQIEYESPTNEIERKMKTIWEEVLSVERIGITDNFFELGGHSLLIMSILGRIDQVFHVNLQLKDVFDHPTIKELSQLVLTSEESIFSSIEPVKEKEYYKLSSAQKRMYIVDQLGGNTAYNMPWALKIQGPLSRDGFEKTILALISRHESLRTSFQVRKGEPVQIIHKDPRFKIEYYDLKDGAKEEEIVRNFIRPFDLSQAPLFRVGLIQLAQNEHLLLFDMHHIISDGLSVEILSREFVRLYTGDELPPLQIQYKDFSEWQNNFFKTPLFMQQEKYWMESLTGKLPQLEMPTDFVRPVGQTFAGNSIRFTITREMVEKLDSFVKEKNLTLNILFLSLYFLLLYKYTNQEDIIIGSLVGGRSHVELENIIGMFGNFLPIRGKVEPASTFSKFLDSAGKTILDAYDNQDYPFERIIDLLNYPVDLSRNPLFDTMLIFHNGADTAIRLEIDDLKFTSYPLANLTAKLDFKIDICLGEKGGLSGILEYNVGLFKKETMEDFIRHFQLLISEVIEKPHQELAKLEIFTKEEKLTFSQKREHNRVSPQKPVSMVISATFTPDPVRDHIKWWANQFGLDINVVFAPYNQVFQEILDEKSLTSTNGDGGVNLLLIRFEDWIRDLDLADEGKCEKLESNFKNLIKIFKDKPKAVPYFVGIFPSATHLSLSPMLLDYLEDMYRRWKKILEEIDNVYVMDFTRLRELYAVDEIFDPLTDREGHLPFSAAFYAAMGTTIARDICALKGNVFKVIVLDCDNTLWRGICGEDGPLGVSVDTHYLELQRFMIRKYNQGFLLAICSKNNEADVWEVFEKNPGMLLKKEHFVNWKINWQAKSENIKALAQELNLGIDSFIFLDDSPVECSEVMTNCPEVLTLQLPENPGSIHRYLNHVWAFDKVKVTEEDRMRTRMYLAEQKRKESEKESLTLNDFLANLQLKISMNLMKPSQVSRVSQLTLRTNQFNLSTIRRTEDEIMSLAKETDTQCWVIEVSDRFGDYGLVGVVITKEKKESLFIDTLLLSCRVLGRGVEEAILVGLRKYCQDRQLKELEAHYYPTPKNKPLLAFLQNKWIHQEEQGDYSTYIYSLENCSESAGFADFYYQESFKKEMPQETSAKEDFVLDHIAVAVTDIDQAVSYYRSLSYTCGEITYDPLQRSHLVMCRKNGWDAIELVAAADSHSPTLRITDKNGDWPYHLCYRLRDIEGFLKSLEQQEIQFEIIDDLKPAVLFDNKKVMFLQVNHVGLVELLEDKEGNFNGDNREVVKNNTVRIVVSRPEPSLAFYKHLGYGVVKNINSPEKLEIILVKTRAGKIELVVPKDSTLQEHVFLSKNGPHIYQLCFDYDEGSAEDPMANAVERNIKNSYIRYRKRLKPSAGLPGIRGDWTIGMDKKHTGKLLHKNQLLPLENHTAELLLGLPTYRVDESIASRGKYEPPRNKIEKKLVEIWQKILRVEPIGVNETFFQLGGNSLKAITLISEVHKVFNVELSLKNIFENKTIKALQGLVADSEQNLYSSIEVVELQEYYPLSSAQKRLYILQQMEPGNMGYNMATAVVLEGSVDKARLEDTFAKLIERHETLRTSFEVINGEPVQKIHEQVKFEIQYYEDHKIDETELSEGTSGLHPLTKEPAARSPQSAAVLISSFMRPFDLSKAPLLRVGLIHSPSFGGHHISQEVNPPDKYILVLDMHHIISDGISHVILVQEIMKMYAGEELSPLTLQYKDYSGWQNFEKEKEAIKKQEKYWRKEFEEEVPVLSLPTDYPRPAVQVFEGSTISFKIGEKETGALKTCALETGATLYMVLLALYNIFLSKVSNQEDIVVGTPLAGRRHSDLQQTIGVFVNTLALRNNPAGEKTFTAFLEEVRERTLEAFANQDCQYEDLVEQLAFRRDPSRNPLFDSMFVLQNIEFARVEVPGLKLLPYEYEKKTSKFDLSLYAYESGESLTFAFEYSTRLFKKETIERFIGYFTKLVTAVVENPGQRIGQIEMLPKEEKHLLLAIFNNTTADYPRDKTVHELFEAQAAHTPHHLAALFRDRQLTYQELHKRAVQLGGLLREKGAAANTIVGLMTERSLEMMVGILGILQAGGAYLPIDPHYPLERKKYLLRDSHTRLLLTQKPFQTPFGVECDVVELGDIYLYTGYGENLENPNTPKDAAYIIYTSGSTGKPKGVMIHHHSLVNRLNWMQKKYPINKSDTILQKTPFTFDVSVWELFWWGLVGAKVCFLIPGGEKDPGIIIDTIGKNKVTVMHFVPSMLNAFLEYLNKTDAIKELSVLKQVIASGEALTPLQVELFNKLLAKSSGTNLANLYGPTEATIDVSYFDCSPGESFERIPIGKPIDNIQLHILDKRLQALQPVGVAGELCISGVGLASGYINRPELTSEKFIKQVTGAGDRCRWETIYNKKLLRGVPGRRRQKIYRTGDLARWLPDGNIDFLGRLDHQVKIRGFRIELAEIERQLLNHKEIKEAVVLLKESAGISSVSNTNGKKYLSAYIVAQKEFNAVSLREYLSKELPDYMVPSSFIQVEQIPLTLSGKVDRKALESYGTELQTGVEFVAPRNDIEIRIANLWEEVLQVDKVGIDENFFDLGGTSMDMIKLNVKLNEIFNVDGALMKMFRFPTIRSFARYLNPGRKAIGPQANQIDPPVSVDRIKNRRANRKNKRRGYNYV